MDVYCLTNPLQSDPEIKPLQTALRAAGLYGGRVDGVFGAGTGDGCYRAKYRLGYPLAAVNHCGGQTLLNYLRGSVPLPQAYRLRRWTRGFGLTKAERQRRAIVEYALWGAVHEPSIHYDQRRPMDHLDAVEVLPWWTDCSEFVTTLYKWAGAPDPNGLGYDGSGYTGTLLSHGTFVAVYQAKAADLAIWGTFPGHHTAVLVEDGAAHPDPLIVSHGSESGPKKMRLSEETRAQRGRPLHLKRYIND